MDVNSSPTELATIAIERVWQSEAEGDGENWKNGVEAGEGTLMISKEGPPSVGIVLQVKHDQMNSWEEHIIVPSCLALANAGFHHDAEKLRRQWEKASDDTKLGALAEVLLGN